METVNPWELLAAAEAELRIANATIERWRGFLQQLAGGSFDPKRDHLWPTPWREQLEEFWRWTHIRSWNSGFQAACNDHARLAKLFLRPVSEGERP